MEYRSKYKAEEIEAILDAKNNTGEGVDSNLDVMFTGQLQTKEVEVSEDTTIKADEGFLGLKEVSVKVSGGGSASSIEYIDVSGDFDDISHKSILLTKALQIRAMTNFAGLCVASYTDIDSNMELGNSVVDAAQAISIDTSTPIVIGGNKILISDFFNAILPQIGLSIEWYNALPRITKEQFYTL